jgi:hypothetical protein
MPEHVYVVYVDCGIEGEQLLGIYRTYEQAAAAAAAEPLSDIAEIPLGVDLQWRSLTWYDIENDRESEPEA